ncbi:hypothetical protein E1297_03485 [Roseibium sp. RKSG952]|nr:hypothetical protein [Roseibium sp. RKSG952]
MLLKNRSDYHRPHLPWLPHSLYRTNSEAMPIHRRLYTDAELSVLERRRMRGWWLEKALPKTPMAGQKLVQSWIGRSVEKR